MDSKPSSIDLFQARRPTWGKVNPGRWKMIRNHVSGKVLDIGCSSGDYVIKLRNSGYSTFGVDIITDADWNLSTSGVFSQGDINNLPFKSESFNTVLAFEILEHTLNPHVALGEIQRVCKNKLILSVPDCEVPLGVLSAGLIYSHWVDPTHYQFYNQSSLLAQLEQFGFSINEIKKINMILPDLPMLTSFYMPFRVAYFLSRVTAKIPGRKKYFRTILIAADKNS